MSTIYVQDRQTYKVTHREYTDEGFLRVPGIVAKTGTQDYLRRELGLDGNPDDIVTVYRPEEEVFNDASLESYDGADITVKHPGELVNSKNYKQTTVGIVKGKATRDGDFVVANLLIKDHDAIQAVNDGMAELSAGYTAEYVMQDGETESGQKYQYLQRGIKINHVAIVPMARAGRQARIFDNQPREKTMTKITLDSGRSVEVQDEATAMLVTDAFERLNQSVTDANKAVEDAQAEVQQKQAVIDAHAEEIAKLKAQTTDEVIREKVQAIAKTMDSAIKIAGDTFKTESLDSVAIMREAMQVARPATQWADKSEHYVQAAFDMALDSANADPEQKNKEQLRRIAEDGAQGMKPTTDAYQEYANRFTQPPKMEA